MATVTKNVHLDKANESITLYTIIRRRQCSLSHNEKRGIRIGFIANIIKNQHLDTRRKCTDTVCLPANVARHRCQSSKIPTGDKCWDLSRQAPSLNEITWNSKLNYS